MEKWKIKYSVCVDDWGKYFLSVSSQTILKDSMSKLFYFYYIRITNNILCKAAESVSG